MIDADTSGTIQSVNQVTSYLSHPLQTQFFFFEKIGISKVKINIFKGEIPLFQKQNSPTPSPLFNGMALFSFVTNTT